MSRITGFWKRHVTPIVTTAVRGYLGRGSPTPQLATTARQHAAVTGCEWIDLGQAPRLGLPPHGVTGDLASVDRVGALLANPIARETYDRLLRGSVVQRTADRFVAVLENGRVTHDAGVVIASGGEVLEDVSGIGFSSDVPTNPLRLSHLPRQRGTPHTVAVLTNGTCHNFFHWMMEAVPRLDLYERSGVTFDRVYAPIRHRFQRDSLALLGIPRNRILPATRPAHVAAARLMASSVHGSPSRWKTDFLFDRLTSGLPPFAGTGSRIYIARRHRRSRAVVNETEILAELEPLGFERCVLESMPLADQIAVFHRAEWVVGPHGAGLTNLAFCRPGTHVVEIGTPYRPWACFYEIAHHRGLDYHLHMASPVNVRHFDPQTGVGDSDLWVEPRGLQGVVAGLLEEGMQPRRRMAA